MSHAFKKASHVSLYRKYRMQTPAAVTETILEYLRKVRGVGAPYRLAVDVGCGSGQNTLTLAPYFDRVLGTDVSPEQIAEARKEPGIPSNVTYDVSAAEQIPVRNGSVDLVTAALALHWFDLAKFYPEVQRALTPRVGIMAAIGHIQGGLVDREDAAKSAALAELCHNYDRKVSAPYRRSKQGADFNRFADLPFPFADVTRSSFGCDVPMNLERYLAYTMTGSSFQKFLIEKPEDAMEIVGEFRGHLLDLLTSDTAVEPGSVQCVAHFDYYVIIGRNEQKNPVADQH